MLVYVLAERNTMYLSTGASLNEPAVLFLTVITADPDEQTVANP